jgi:hypothetical protein
MAAEEIESEKVATQAAASTETSGGSAGNNTTTGGTGPIASSTPVAAPNGLRSELQQLLQGWQEVIPSGSTFPSSAGSFDQPAVLARLQGYLAAYTDLDTHVTGANEARAQVRSQMAEAKAYCSALKAAVITYLGSENSPRLAKFGLKPRKSRAPLTSEQLAVRAAKVRATRKLRGTMGPRKKAGIKSGPMQFVSPVAPAERESSTPNAQQTVSAGTAGASSAAGSAGP